MAAIPATFSRRSFVYRRLAGHGAEFTELAGAAVAQRYGDGDEAARARSLGLADLSPLPRTGFKGRGALAWLKTRKVAGLGADNRATAQTDGSVAARLAPTEALILGPLDGSDTLCARLDRGMAPGCYRVMRREVNFWFLVTGDHAAAMFAKICGVDLRPGTFPDLAIAQTSVARSNAIVIRQDMGATVAYHLLGDSASAEFFWGVLLDSMAEFDGAPIGIDAVRELA